MVEAEINLCIDIYKDNIGSKWRATRQVDKLNNENFETVINSV